MYRFALITLVLLISSLIAYDHCKNSKVIQAQAGHIPPMTGMNGGDDILPSGDGLTAINPSYQAI